MNRNDATFFLHPRATPRRRRAGVSMTRNLIGLAILGVAAWGYYLVHKGRIASFKVVSGSMEPTIRIGDVWLMEPVGPEGFRVGDIVVFHNPRDPDRTVVKRIVAVAPGRVELRKGLLFVDGRPSPPPTGADEPIDVPDNAWGLQTGEAFAAGDNRAISQDSRAYGPIRLADVKGVLARRLEAAKP
jgi:signal peptidase I